MNKKVLLVDDEPNLLQSLRRSLHGIYDLSIAVGGSEGVKQLRENGPFAVLVCDMQMPDVDGLKVLNEAQRIAPDTVRIMLTGNVDQQTAVDAVNEGAIFRFLNKPCPAQNVCQVLNDALRQHELVTAEKQLLSRTLTGSIAVISEVLSIASPKAFGRSGRLKTMVRRLASSLQLKDAWQYEVAAMLSQIGSISLSLSPAEETGTLPTDKLLQRQAEHSCSIVSRIPRLEKIASMIGLQFADPFDANVPDSVRTGARMLRLVADFDMLCESHSIKLALRKLKLKVDIYGEDLFNALEHMVLSEMGSRSVSVMELTERMILDEDVLTATGQLLICKGQELTESLIHRLMAYRSNSVGVREPIAVRCERPPITPPELGVNVQYTNASMSESQC